METDDEAKASAARPFSRDAIGARVSEPSGAFRSPDNVHVDLSAFPIVRTTLPEVVDVDVLDQIFTGLRKAEARGQPYVHVTDLTTVHSFDGAKLLAAIRAYTSAHVVERPTNCRASASIAPSVFLRGVVRAAFALSSAAVERKVFSTQAQANDWALQKVGGFTGSSRRGTSA